MKSYPGPPRSPFSTRLSGSAKETELRLRSIFQWKKQRPPVWLMLLTAAICLSCGSLVSCQTRPAGPELVMEVQHYDTAENYIEIPALAMSGGGEPDAGVTAINEALAELKNFYQPVLDGTAGTDGSDLMERENRCLLYPTETERYLCLTFFRDEYHIDLNTGRITSLVYDKETGRQVTLDDALELAGQDEAGLFQALADQYDPTLEQDVPGADLCIQDQTLEGFRMGAAGRPVFYLTARTDDRDDGVQDAVSGADNLYIWQDGSFTLYDQHVLEPEPLVPAEECLDLDPPLWRQWHFAGEEPEGGFSSASGLEPQDRTLLNILYNAARERAYMAVDSMDEASPVLLHASSRDGYTLAAASFRDASASYLVICAIEDTTGTPTVPAYVLGGQGGVPHVAAYEPYGEEGETRLLYTFNSMSQRLVYGESGAVGLADGRLTWSWPVEGDILAEGSQAQADYYTYWADHLALMAPGGVDVFTQTNYSVVDGDGPQWVPDHNETFWYTDEQNLPTGVYYQTRVWLEEFTRSDHNPWDAANVSAAWQIASLVPADGMYPDRNFDGQAVYDLTARADNGDDLYFTASLLFDHGAGQITQVLDYAMGTGAELGLSYQALQLARRTIAHFDLIYTSPPQLTTLLTRSEGARTLILVSAQGAPHVAGLDNLLLGVWDEREQVFVGESFLVVGDAGLYSTWDSGGATWLLCTNSVTFQGDETGSGIGLFRFSGGELEQVLGLPQAALDSGVLPDTEEARCLLYGLSGDSEQSRHSADFWLTHRAVPGTGGLSLYEKNPAYNPYSPSPEGVDQWQYVGFVPLTDFPAEDTSAGTD